jgi:SagB-type dehydrogenase family enzyme
MKFFAFGQEAGDVVKLPSPRQDSGVSVEQALQSRRSVREYADQSLTLVEISQLLWAAQGKTHPYGLRTAPSAGALYPLELFIVAGRVDDLDAGIYRYRSHEHDLIKVADGDKRADLCNAALGQECIREAPAVIVITAVYQRVMKKYGDRGIMYTHVEVGCAAENVCLQAETLNLGTVVMGAFHDDRVQKVIGAGDDEEPLAIMPVGRKK